MSSKTEVATDQEDQEDQEEQTKCLSDGCDNLVTSKNSGEGMWKGYCESCSDQTECDVCGLEMWDYICGPCTFPNMCR
jgi:hypothetical protein